METELSNEIGVQELIGETAVLKDGSMIAVLEVAPIDFDGMGEARKKKVVKAYRAWLDALDYPVQIVMRTYNFDIQEQAKVLKNRVEYTIKQKEEFRDLLKEYKEFEEWLDRYLKENSKKGSLYYLVIPYFPKKKKKRLFKFLAKAKIKEETDNSIAMLNKRVSENIELLEKTGVKAHRLGQEQLRNLFMSYFTIINKVGSNGKLAYVSPENWFDDFKNEVKA